MKTTTKNIFKALDFMRQVRNELSTLYHTDKKLYHEELKKAMADFLAERSKAKAKPANKGKKSIKINY